MTTSEIYKVEMRNLLKRIPRSKRLELLERAQQCFMQFVVYIDEKTFDRPCGCLYGTTVIVTNSSNKSVYDLEEAAINLTREVNRLSYYELSPLEDFLKSFQEERPDGKTEACQFVAQLIGECIDEKGYLKPVKQLKG